MGIRGKVKAKGPLVIVPRPIIAKNRANQIFLLDKSWYPLKKKYIETVIKNTIMDSISA